MRFLIVGLIAVAVYLTYTSPLYAMGQRLQGVGLLGNANDLAAVAVLIIPFIVIPLLGRGGTAFGLGGRACRDRDSSNWIWTVPVSGALHPSVSVLWCIFFSVPGGRGRSVPCLDRDDGWTCNCCPSASIF